MVDTLTLFLGEHQPYDYFCAFTGDNTDFVQQIEDYINTAAPNDIILFFTDILGGSVNKEISKFLYMPNIYILSGFNFPMLLQFAALQDTVDAIQLRLLTSCAKESIVYVNDFENARNST
jgi:mannose/fructose-specific phosphotransferase system component IIA